MMRKVTLNLIIGMIACTFSTFSLEGYEGEGTLSNTSIKNLDEEGWERVYLATYPRSGNHWMRYLLEEATGVATSSVYRDASPQHDKVLYPWGAYSINGGYIHTARLPTKEDIVIIKTHFPALQKTPRDENRYLKSLRILRHPIDSFYSYYCYRYSPIEILPWDWIEECCVRWEIFQEYWNNQSEVITIRYEDLLYEPLKTLHKGFSGIGLATDNIDYAIAHHPPQGAPLKHIEHYTQAQLDYIEAKLSGYMKKMGYTISSIEETWENDQ